MEARQIGIVLILIALATLGTSYFKHGSLSGHTVVCDVNLQNYPGLETNIKSYSCYPTEGCFIQPMAFWDGWINPKFFEDRGVLEVTIGTGSMRTEYVVYESLYETYPHTVSGCFSDGSHQAIIKLLDDSIVVDSESFTMEVN